MTRPLRSAVAVPATAALLALIVASPCLAGSAAESGWRALGHVRALAGDLGPRRTGSDSERRAVEYVRRAFEAAGLEVALQEVAVVETPDGEARVGSWNVVGRLPADAPGRSADAADAIVVGAHHDSAGSRVPGANDDASGLAVLIESARLAAARPRRVDHYFVSFCAEEEGLLGSKHFVKHHDVSRVRAMIALELLGRGEILVAPVPQPPPEWAQRAVLRAARRSRIGGVAARPVWTLAPRFLALPYSADHAPFLERGIPAFLLLGTYPGWSYHTARDTVAGIRPETLERAVDLLDALLRDLDAAPPVVRDDPHHLPLTLFGQGTVASSRVLWALCGAALLLWLARSAMRVREALDRRVFGETLRALIVTAAATALGLTGPFFSEKLMERIHDVRFPWMAHHGLHVAQAAAAAALTGWLALNLFRRIKPTVDPRPYLTAAFALPVAWVAAALYAGWPEIGAIMAVPVLAFIASELVTSPGRKIALGGVALLPFGLILTLSDYRALVDLGGVAPPARVLFAALFTCVFPFALYTAHVAAFQDCLHSRFWWWLSGRRVALGALAAFVTLAGANAALLPYDEKRPQVVRAWQEIDLDRRSASLRIDSADSLAGVRLGGLTGSRFSGRAGHLEIPFPESVGFETTAESSGAGAARVVTLALRVRAPRPVARTTYTFRSRSGFGVPGRGQEVRHQYTVETVALRTEAIDRVELRLAEGGDLAVEATALFDDDLTGIGAAGGPRVFTHGASLAATRVLYEGAPPPAAASPADDAAAPERASDSAGPAAAP